MTYVIYNKETTKYLRVMRNGYWQDAKYESLGAAKAALTREAKRGRVNVDKFAIAEYTDFYKNIEKNETVVNIMSGKPVTQSVNTPGCCDVSQERYWSM